DSYVKFGQAKAGTNYYKITATDEKTTKTLLNKAYTVTGGSKSAASTLTVTGYNYPSGTLAQGKSFSIKGTVSSNYKIKSVTVGIYNASGAGVSTKTVNPNAKSYNIANIDAYIKFGSAKAGTNYYKITATDEKVTKTLVNKSYTVKSNDPASTLKATNCNYPTTLEEGKSYSIKGTITSNYKITSVTVGIYNANGGTVSAKTVNPNATSYSIASIDAYIKFGAAKAGTNYYKITASDTKKSATLINQKYTVKAKQAAASTLALSGHTVPTTLNVGQSFTLKGSITSNYTITKVTVGIYNANGGAVSTRTVTPNSKSFNIATIDSYIKFGQAKAGTNYYKIVATDQKTTKTLLNQAYTVKSNDVASTLSISGHNVPPAELGQGKSFTIKGTVSSNYNITSLTVGIYNANGGEVSVKTVSPNAKSYSISNVDAYIKFGQAQPGTNYYRIKATDQKTTKTLVDSAYNVKGSTASSSLAISGHNVPPAELGLGKSFSIYGTVSSNYNITSLTVGIYTESGTPVSTKTISPNAKSYSISKIDAYIKFGAAGKGEHYYKIVATDSKQTKTLVNSKYTVVSSDTSAPTTPSGRGADDIVAVAKTQVGKSGRPNDYTRWYGPIGGSYSYAWCATFTSWCANQAGISKSVIPPECSCSRMVDAFKKLGSDIIKDPSYNPVKGDIIFFDTSASGIYNHVGIVVSYDKNTGAITTIEGNTSDTNHANGDTVAQKTRYRKSSGISVSAFAHPKYPATTSSSSSGGSSTGKTISSAQAKKIAGDITAAFEGGYEAVAGNSDGQGISVGFFQWNIGQGTLQPMLSKFLNNHTSEAKSIFGTDKYNGLKTMLGKSSRSDQLAWVKNNIIKSDGKTIKDDWKACLKSMCRTDSFKAIEVEAAENWFNQGKALFKKYNLTTLRSYCLCIDIAVQNWDVSSYMGSTSGKSEKQIQQMLVEAAVAKTKAAYKADVRSRKGTIANGSGTVHGATYNMERDFGLTDQVITW
ncbi:MAG: CHAP domain-containing protein, partial [Acutalibacteraceae bacterium]